MTDSPETAEPTHLDLDRIEGLAKAATPGPWKVYEGSSWRRIGVEPNRGAYDGAVLAPTVASDGHPDLTSYGGNLSENLAYIAALDPTTVTAMITRIRELEGAFEPLLAAAEGLSHGEDWNNGTHAKHHKYRQKLLDAIAPARTALQRKTP